MTERLLSHASSLLNLRKCHPAWQLLLAHTGPLLISSLRSLFDENLNGIDLDTAVQELSEVLHFFHEAGEIEIKADYPLEARREIRQWIRRGLVVEREGVLIATDALESAFRFVDGLDNRIMTSTASRLSIVQREIENIESSINPDPKSRESLIRHKIAALETELASVLRGEVEVLPEQAAIEAIREVYNLSMSLRNDFRRVEDSYREADQRLRQSIIGEQSHRGDIVDSLLESHRQLLQTDEGKVFDTFQQQLAHHLELDNMKQHIRSLVKQPVAHKALTREQQTELRLLVMRLVGESESVIRARARSERDVKGFIKTGLASEHHRVGQLLNEIFAQATRVDWSRQAVRRKPATLPPIGVANSTLPVLERLRFKDLDKGIEPILDLVQQTTNLDEVDGSFWSSFDTLDRQALMESTLTLLTTQGRSMSIGEIASMMPPNHDLESMALWLTMALEADIPFTGTQEQVDLGTPDGTFFRFTLPRVELNSDALTNIKLEL
ncbi:MAG: DUF3375 domain-containing protein [Candidatus Thiodiazotropha sp. (ex Troendleina suluensis)]|nr:DUF3375 domain-containing protein [Candidatus Thiodiazotropha sp. (ex Troendleina suluensis)]